MKASGQIVLFRFPRTDLAAGKLRPALLISEAPGPYDDWLICMISSQQHQQIEGFGVDPIKWTVRGFHAATGE